MRQTVISIFVLIIWQASQGQFFHKIGLGMSTGYRFNSSSIYIEGCLNRFAINGEYIINKNQGLGFSISGGYYLPLDKNRVMPFAGVAYTKMLGGGVSIDWGQSNNTNFEVSSATYLIPTIGMRYNFLGIIEREKYIRKGFLAVIVRLGYRLLLTKQPEVVFVSGDIYESKQKKIQSSINEGLGFSIGFVMGFGKKEMRR